MNIRYFEDTDTVLLEFSASAAVETREISEDVYVDLDKDRHVVSITIEHAGDRACMSELNFQRVQDAEPDGLLTAKP